MYTMKMKIPHSATGITGTVQLHGIMSLLQDVNCFEMEDMHMGADYMHERNLAWVVMAYRLKYIKPLRLNDEVEIGTDPISMNGLTAIRQYYIKDKDGEFAVQAEALWVVMDWKSRRMTRISDELKAGYDFVEAFPSIGADRKLKLSGDKTEGRHFFVKKNYIDSNGHMNNVEYITEAEEMVPDEFVASGLDVTFRKEAVRGMEVVPYLYDNEDHYGVEFEDTDGNGLAAVKLWK